MSESESLVERVARALDPLAWAALGLADTEKLAFRRKRSMEQAVVAIRAMREPTEAMLEAGALMIGGGPDWRPGRTEAVIASYRETADSCHTAMIDAALA